MLPVLLALSVSGCASTNSQNDAWETEEILMQLSELRKEIGYLKKDLGDLKQDVARLGQERAEEQRQESEIDINSAFSLGSDDAKVAIIEFTDYQCPFCRKHTEKTFPVIKNQLIDTGRVKYFVKDFPLGFHGLAKSAAVAARCAGEQGKYWEMHDLVFDRQQQLNQASFSAFADRLSLNIDQFKECSVASTALEGIEADINDGKSMGVQGTPAFFVGRIRHSRLVDAKALYGTQGYGSFLRIIDQLERN